MCVVLACCPHLCPEKEFSTMRLLALLSVLGTLFFLQTEAFASPLCFKCFDGCARNFGFAASTCGRNGDRCLTSTAQAKQSCTNACLKVAPDRRTSCNNRCNQQYANQTAACKKTRAACYSTANSQNASCKLSCNLSCKKFGHR